MVDEDLKRMVKSNAERLERLVMIATGDDEMRTEEEIAWLSEECGQDITEDFFLAAQECLVDNLGIKVMGSKWLSDGGDFEIEGVEVVLCTGGPHIEFESADNHVIGVWGGQSYSVPVGHEVKEWFLGLVEDFG